MPDPLEEGVRGLLAGALGMDSAAVAALPGGTRLFDELGLDSLTGTSLLAAVRSRYAVDIAADDLNLESLETIDSLCGFIRTHAAGG
jgi:acyl carrier protein